MIGTKVTIRLRMGAHDAHYAGELVDGARMLALFGPMYQHEAPTLQQYQMGLIGDPVRDAAVYKAASPLTYIHALTAPLLILQGENDIRVPREQAANLAAVLKADGRTVDAHFYANEGHGFAKRENQIDALERTIAWFDRYLKPVRAD